MKDLRNPRFSASVELTIPFHDIDLMGVVWHGHYVRYFEVAREKLLNQLNFGYRTMLDSGYMWPVVDMQIKYRHAILFEQCIVVTAVLKEYENRLGISYTISDKATNKRLTTAHSIQVAIDAKSKELCFVTPSICLERMGLN